MYLFVFILQLLILLPNAYSQLNWVDFDYSMQVNNDLPKNELYQQLSQVYYNNHPDEHECSSLPLIPKKIHQIWLGPVSIPQQYQEYAETWKKLHPDWEYKLWRESDIEFWEFSTRDLFNKASSYQEKSDILRYEILNKFGGLYVDMDYKAIKRMDDLHCLYNFYGSIEPPLNGDNQVTITNAIIGSSANNKILDRTLALIREHWNDVEAGFREEAKHLGDRSAIIHLAVNRTMMPFNQAIREKIDVIPKSVILPPTYLSIEVRSDKLFDPLKRMIGINSRRLFFRTIWPETMATQNRGGNRIIFNLSDVNIDEPWYIVMYYKLKIWFITFFA